MAKKKATTAKPKPATQGVLPGMPKATRKLIKLGEVYCQAEAEKKAADKALEKAKDALADGLEAEGLSKVKAPDGLLEMSASSTRKIKHTKTKAPKAAASK